MKRTIKNCGTIILFFSVFSPLSPDATLLYAQTGNSFTQKLQLARFYVKDKEYDKAESIYEQLYKSQPAHTAVFNEYKQVLFSLQMYEKIITLLDEKLLVAKNNLNFLGEKARVYYQWGKENEARNTWESMIKLKPNDQNIYTFVSQQQQRLRLMEDAINTLLLGRKALNNPIVFANVLSALYNSMGNYTNAAREYLNWLKSDPRYLAHVERSINGFRADSSEIIGITSEIEKFVNASDDNANVKRLLAGYYIKNNEYGKAFVTYAELDEAMKEHGGQYVLSFADQLRQMGVYDHAIEGYMHLLENYPKFKGLDKTRFGLANALEGSGFGDSANKSISDSLRQYYREWSVREYNNTINLHKNTTWALSSHFQLGNIKFTHLSDIDGAIQSYQNITKSMPTLPLAYRAYIKIGDAYLAKGDIARAQEHYTKLDNAKADLKDLKLIARFKFMLCDYYRGAFDKVDTELANLLAAAGRNSDLSNDLISFSLFFEENSEGEPGHLQQYAKAEFLALQNKNAEAEKVLLRLIEAEPEQPIRDDALFKVAGIRKKMTRYEEAITALDILRTSFPDSKHTESSHLEIAKIYEENLSNINLAITEYEKFVVKYTLSIRHDEIRKKLRELQKNQ